MVLKKVRALALRCDVHTTAPPDYSRARQSLFLLIAAHVITMTMFPIIARLPGPVWDDMMEAWAWGQQFQLGYYKHPPLYAWISGLWFRILPRTDASYYALSAINIGAGLAGVWRLSRLLLRGYPQCRCCCSPPPTTTWRQISMPTPYSSRFGPGPLTTLSNHCRAIPGRTASLSVFFVAARYLANTTRSSYWYPASLPRSCTQGDGPISALRRPTARWRPVPRSLHRTPGGPSIPVCQRSHTRFQSAPARCRSIPIAPSQPALLRLWQTRSEPPSCWWRWVGAGWCWSVASGTLGNRHNALG